VNSGEGINSLFTLYSSLCRTLEVGEQKKKKKKKKKKKEIDLAALAVLMAHSDTGGCSRWCCYGGRQWLMLVSVFFFFLAAFCYLYSFFFLFFSFCL
jgi:hypothetical protein